MADAELLILGGGATGLTAAYLAARAGHRVVVLEGSDRPGGLLETFPIGGTRLEHYYHHFFTHDAEIRWLVEQLGIAHKLKYLPATMGIFRKGRSWNFNGPGDLLNFSPLSLMGTLRFAASSVYLGKFAQWRKWENVAAMDWFRRYAGKSATDAIWGPMLRIKFGPFAEQVPVAWMVGRLRQRMGSREGSDERLGYVDGSLQVVLDALMLKLQELGVTVVTGAKVTKLGQDHRGIRTAETSGGTWSGLRVLSTIPTNQLWPLISEEAPALAQRLQEIGYFGAVCTVLEMDAPLSEIYWLNVADSGFPFGGVIEHTNFIPPSTYQGRHIAYLSRYFEPTNELSQLSKEEIAEQMIRPLERIYGPGVRKHIRDVYVFRTMTAATVCGLNFSRKVPPARTAMPNFYLASMAHIYPDERSFNNSIRVAAEVCRVMGLETADVPRGASLSGQIGME